MVVLIHPTILRLPCTKYAAFEMVYMNKSLKGHLIQRDCNVTDVECMKKCIEHVKCQSYNTNRSSRVCELSSKAIASDAGTQLSDDPGWVYKSTDYKNKLVSTHFFENVPRVFSNDGLTTDSILVCFDQLVYTNHSASEPSCEWKKELGFILCRAKWNVPLWFHFSVTLYAWVFRAPSWDGKWSWFSPRLCLYVLLFLFPKVGPVCNNLKPCLPNYLCKDTCTAPFYECLHCHEGLHCDKPIGMFLSIYRSLPLFTKMHVEVLSRLLDFRKSTLLSLPIVCISRWLLFLSVLFRSSFSELYVNETAARCLARLLNLVSKFSHFYEASGWDTPGCMNVLSMILPRQRIMPIYMLVASKAIW